MASKKKPAGRINKSEFVRNIGDLPAATVVAEAKKKGIKLTENYVYTIRSAAKKKNGKAKSLLPHRPEGTTGGKTAVLLTAGRSSEKAFVDLVLDIGLSRAQRLIDNLRSMAKNA
jgi:hypothetical protein